MKLFEIFLIIDNEAYWWKKGFIATEQVKSLIA